ncbi:hypothetical protein GCM10023191_070080 [Actinoallomurus oryzae]|uniref:Uncharacterized protein n=1 Tax=Actinoallomurus oryzae TaxID=502180 RepID=A0ABP8QRT3_9ACTN
MGLKFVVGGGWSKRVPGPDDVVVTTSSPVRPVAPFVPDAWSPPSPGPLNEVSPGLTTGGTRLPAPAPPLPAPSNEVLPESPFGDTRPPPVPVPAVGVGPILGTGVLGTVGVSGPPLEPPNLPPAMPAAPKPPAMAPPRPMFLPSSFQSMVTAV